jgi:hypothetical protein
MCFLPTILMRYRSVYLCVCERGWGGVRVRGGGRKDGRMVSLSATVLCVDHSMECSCEQNSVCHPSKDEFKVRE